MLERDAAAMSRLRSDEAVERSRADAEAGARSDALDDDTGWGDELDEDVERAGEVTPRTGVRDATPRTVELDEAARRELIAHAVALSETPPPRPRPDAAAPAAPPVPPAAPPVPPAAPPASPTDEERVPPHEAMVPHRGNGTPGVVGDGDGGRDRFGGGDPWRSDSATREPDGSQR